MNLYRVEVEVFGLGYRSLMAHNIDPEATKTAVTKVYKQYGGCNFLAVTLMRKPRVWELRSILERNVA